MLDQLTNFSDGDSRTFPNGASSSDSSSGDDVQVTRLCVLIAIIGVLVLWTFRVVMLSASNSLRPVGTDKEDDILPTRV